MAEHKKLSKKKLKLAAQIFVASIIANTSVPTAFGNQTFNGSDYEGSGLSDDEINQLQKYVDAIGNKILKGRSIYQDSDDIITDLREGRLS